MTDAELAAIDARLEAATPGPWRQDLINPRKLRGGDGDTFACVLLGTNDADEIAWTEQNQRDMDALAHAPDDLRRLRAEVDRLRALVAKSDLLFRWTGREMTPEVHRLTPAEAERGVLVRRRDGRRERVWPLSPPDAIHLGWGDRVVERATSPDLWGVAPVVEPTPDWRAALEAAGLVRSEDGWRRGTNTRRVIGCTRPGRWWIVTGQRFRTEEEAARAWLARQEARR